jgi:hypothetical protein
MKRETITMKERDQQRALVLTRWIGEELISEEAVALLGLSERQARRLKARFLTEGPAAVVYTGRRIDRGDAVEVLA